MGPPLSTVHFMPDCPEKNRESPSIGHHFPPFRSTLFLGQPLVGNRIAASQAKLWKFGGVDMTKRNKYLHKLGNAWRAMRGTSMVAPQMDAYRRMERWTTRCRARGYVTFSDKPS